MNRSSRDEQQENHGQCDEQEAGTAEAGQHTRHDIRHGGLTKEHGLAACDGPTAGHYDTLISALLWAFAQALGPDFHAREAWRLALTAVAAVMQEAAAGGE